MEIKKILFVTEFEELWFDAVQSLMDLKKTGLNHVVFLHVIERDKVAMHRGVGYLKSEEVKLKEIANVRFIDWAETLFEQGMEVGAHIVVGNIVQKIVNVAEEEDVDLIITGVHKKASILDLTAGSDIMEVLRRTFKPVLILKYNPDTGKIDDKLFTRPLLATDWSEASKRAVEVLKGLKEIVQDTIIVHVASEKEFESDSAMEVQKVRKEYKDKMIEDGDALRAADINAEEHLYVGDVEDQINLAAKERNATMLVCGTTGKGPFREKWLGSTPRELAIESPLPTLLVPPEKR